MHGRGRLLGDPRFTGAVAVLAVNDHALKGWAPGPLTGKLSDVAGVFAVAVVAGVVTGRPRLAVGLTGVAFAAIKVVPGAAALVAPVLGGVTRRDPTDLVALLALVPALRFLAARLPDAPPTRLAPLLGSTAAVLAVTATSCLPTPAVQAFVVRNDGVVVAQVAEHGGADDPDPDDVRWAASRDGGASWSATDPPPAATGTSPRARTELCLPEGGCYRLRGDRVEHAPEESGPFTASFGFSDEDERRMRLRSQGTCGAVPAGQFASLAVVARPDGDHVVVAMGNQGALHRPPGGGGWERVTVLDCRPVSLAGPSWLYDIGWIAPLVAAIVGSLALFPVRRSRRSSGGRRVWLGWVGAVAVVWIASLGLLGWLGILLFAGVDYATAGPLIAALAVGSFVISAVTALRRARPLAPAPPA